MSEHAPVILDIAGPALTEVDRGRLAHPLAGGIILFGRNYQDRDQLAELCAEIKSVREVSIGHALIADALELGYAATVKAYLACIARAAEAAAGP